MMGVAVGVDDDCDIMSVTSLMNASLTLAELFADVSKYEIFKVSAYS